MKLLPPDPRVEASRAAAAARMTSQMGWECNGVASDQLAPVIAQHIKTGKPVQSVFTHRKKA